MYIYVMSMSKLIFRFFENFFGAKPEMGAPGAQICPFHRIRSRDVGVSHTANKTVSHRIVTGGSALSAPHTAGQLN